MTTLDEARLPASVPTTREDRLVELRHEAVRTTIALLVETGDPNRAAAYLIGSVMGAQCRVAGIRGDATP